MEASSSQQQTTTINPTQPTSVGALLAEEYTINPLSTLPSFVETCLIQSASQSTHTTAIETSLRTLVQYLRNRILLSYDDNNNSEEEEEDEEGDSQSAEATNNAQQRRAFSRLRLLKKLRSSFLRWVRRQVVLPSAQFLEHYQLEIQWLVVVYLLERRCLYSNSSSTLSESLYGMKRVKLEQGASSSSPGSNKQEENLSSSTGQQQQGRRRKLSDLSSADKTRAALMEALVPYLQARMDRYYKKCCTATSTTNSSTTSSSSLISRKVMLRIYPWLCTCLHATNMLCQWRYLLGKSVFYNFKTLLLQHVVRRVTQSDLNVVDDSQGNTSTNNKKKEEEGGTKDAVAGEASSASSLATRSIAYCISASIVVSWLAQIRRDWITARQDAIILQRQQQLQQEGAASTSTTTSTAAQSFTSTGTLIPPPPPPPVVRLICDQNSNVWNDGSVSGGGLIGGGSGGGGSSSSSSRGGCPLCHKVPRLHPTTTIPSSGYVFCLTCILPYVQSHGKCPVTGNPCKESDLIRLFEPRMQHQQQQ